jgi:hypothetical protein
MQPDGSYQMRLEPHEPYVALGLPSVFLDENAIAQTQARVQALRQPQPHVPSPLQNTLFTTMLYDPEPVVDDMDELVREFPQLGYNYDEDVPLAPPIRFGRQAQAVPITDAEKLAYFDERLVCQICMEHIPNIPCNGCGNIICVECFNSIHGNPRPCPNCRHPFPAHPVQLQLGGYNNISQPLEYDEKRTPSYSDRILYKSNHINQDYLNHF